MIITCASSPFPSLPPSNVASSADSAPTGQSAVSPKSSLSDKINKEIQRLNDLKKPLEQRNNDQYNPLTDEDQKRLNDCQSKLDALKTVQKLAEFADQLDTNKTNSNNILNNLCSGLEKFLGFNSDSKGYDGTGIVYSDLDRLCDGVMGFLSGVLSNIKDHLGQHKEEIKPVIKVLEDTKHLGKKGFNDAIGSVVEGVRGYNESVMKSNNKVSDVITKMQREMNKYTENALKQLLEEKDYDNSDKVKKAVEQIDRELEDCKNAAKEFNDAFDLKNKDTMIKDVEDLNAPLSVKVKSVAESVKHESERLNRMAERQKRELQETTAKIKSVLNSMKCEVDSKIGEEVKDLLSKLRQKITPIKKLLDDITAKLSQYIIDLQTWMNETKEFIEDLRNNEMKKIVNETSDKLTGKTNLIEDAVKHLEKTRKSLTSYIDVQVKPHLRELVKDAKNVKVAQLEGWKTAAGSVVSAAKEKCAKIGGMVVTKGASNGEIYKQAEDMKKKAEELRKAAKNIKTNIQQWVQKALTQVKDMDDALKKDLRMTKDAINVAIKHLGSRLESRVKKDLGKLKGKITAPLGVLVDTASNFYKKLCATQNAIDGAIEKVHSDLEMLKELSNIDEIRRGAAPLLTAIGDEITDPFDPLKKYFGELERNVMQNVKGEMKKIGTVIGAMYSHSTIDFKPVDLKSIQPPKISTVTIGGDLVKGIPDLELSEHTKVIEKVLREASSIRTLSKDTLEKLLTEFGAIAEAVSKHSHKVVESVMDAIQKKVSDDIESVASAINEKVNAIRQGIKEQSTDRAVVYYIGSNEEAGGLKALVTQFNEKIKKKLDSFQSEVENNFFKKVVGAAGVENNYDLSQVMSNFHSTYTTLVSGVLNNSGGIGDMLNDQIGPTKGNTISGFAERKFTGYKNQVNVRENGAELTGTSDGSEGTLPAAIGEIKTKVTGKLNEGELGSQIESADTFQTPFDQITAKLNDVAGLVDSTKKTGVSTNDGIQQYLDDLKDKGFETGDGSTWKSLAGPSAKGLVTIKGEITTALDGIDTYASNISVSYITDGLDKVSTEITKQLEELKHAIDQTTSAVHAKLIALKNDKIGNAANSKTIKENTLQAISDKLEKLQRGLVTDAIRDTKSLLDTYLTKAEEYYVKELKSHLNTQVKQAMETLTTHSQKQYFLSTVQLLSEFSNRVTQQLNGLPDDISLDLTLGFKSFMASFEKDFITDSRSISGIRHINPKLTSPRESLLSKAADLVNYSFGSFFVHLENQEDFKRDFTKLQASKKSLTKLLSGLLKSLHFDDKFSTNLDALNNVVTAFKPTTYGEAKCPSLLNALKAGFTPLVEELNKAYVSTYSLRTIEWEKLTEAENRNYAKICWTITPILYQELSDLKHGLEYGNWNDYKIYHPADINSSLHALFFRDNGYDVHRPENAEHGELNHRNDFNGNSILKHLANETHNLFSQSSSPVTDIPRSASGSDELDVTVAEESGLIHKLYDFLQTYFSVCHLTIIDKPRAPCSVYEILVWCCGLQFNPVYEKLKAQVKSEFMKEDKLNPGTKKLQPFDAHPSPVKYGDVEAELYKVSSDSHAVLTAILGHGHKDGIYACEFSTNSLKLDYPTSMIQLLCTLFDLLKRLYHQLYFLLQQCRHNAQLSGWNDCHYGRYIGGSGWQCNTKQCPKQDCDQRHDQSGSQTGEQYPNCGVKSPLQSFLEDGLKGHLPHSVSARGSSLSCGTCGSTPGMPCRTPMGFADISAIASHTMIGKNICEVLYAFCGSSKSPLTRLCGYLNCFMPSAPKTLADMFSFYYHLTDRWGMHGNKHKKEAVEEKVNAANFGRSYGELKVYYLFTPSHSALKKGHSDGSLGSLVCSSKDSVVCGPFLRPISHSIYETFSSKHADKYLSWVVYLTATFYDLLKKLYDECNSKCGVSGSNCHVKACVKECPTTSKQDPPRYHHRNCQSIVKCSATLPTLAKYGFVFGDPERLSGSQGIEKKRTCRDLCTVFAEAFEENSHLVQFFKAIDNFMFTIRQPFLWMTVALWSLSLCYLICVMVGRLDVLHIKSHLRIPSSHRITAQSLLAAAQVGRLAKISYLQP